MAEAFDTSAMIEGFQERGPAARRRGVPPVEGPERRQFIEQAQLDFQDFAMLGDATATLEDGAPVLRVALRPPAESGCPPRHGDTDMFSLLRRNRDFRLVFIAQ